MKRDFTLETYRSLIGELKGAGYRFFTVKEYSRSEEQDRKIVIMRHDVDSLLKRAFHMAVEENKLGIRSTYYFRSKGLRDDGQFIKRIARAGHEIGYHYEDLAKAKGDYDRAIGMFQKNLEALRKISPVATICMHGSPLSRWDNKKLWERFDYRAFGIMMEPANESLGEGFVYFTDTGRRWNSKSANLRDFSRAASNRNYRTTFSLIRAVKTGTLPGCLFLNTHPQRWRNDILAWCAELIGQNAKNIIKIIVKKMSGRLMQ
jgi:hypothetical protein